MSSSQSSSNSLKNEPVQLPLPGFKVEVKSPKENWRKFIETTLEGRTRVHMVKKG